MKIADARVCLNCEEIFLGPGLCPGCNSEATWLLSKWIRTLNAPAGPPRVIPVGATGGRPMEAVDVSTR